MILFFRCTLFRLVVSFSTGMGNAESIVTVVFPPCVFFCFSSIFKDADIVLDEHRARLVPRARPVTPPTPHSPPTHGCRLLKGATLGLRIPQWSDCAGRPAIAHRLTHELISLFTLLAHICHTHHVTHTHASHHNAARLSAVSTDSHVATTYKTYAPFSVFSRWRE